MSAAAPGTEKNKTFLEFDEFRVDSVRRVLLRDGEPVAVTPKAFSILLVLLEHRGDLVTKDDLIKSIWPGSAVADANLIQNVSALRKSLGERANSARYVATVAGVGYSFAAPVREVERIVPGAPLPAPDPAPSPEPAPLGASAPDPLEESLSPPLPAAAAPEPRRPRTSRRAWWLLAAAALAVLGLGLFLQLKRPADPPARPVRRTAAVVSFSNISSKGEARWLDTALAEMFSTELAAGGHVRVIPGDRVVQAWKALSLPPADRLSRADLKRLRGVLGVDMVLTGTYLSIDDRIRLDVRILGVPRGDTEASLAEMGTEEGLFELVSRTGVRLRKALGYPELSPRQEQAARALQPESSAGAKLYAQGLERLRATDPPGALELLRRAAEAEPQSAVIRSALAAAWAATGDDKRAEAEAGLAVKLAGSLPRQERLTIEARYRAIRREWDKASEIYRTLLTFFPDDLEVGLQLVASQTTGGQSLQAAETIAALRRLPAPAGDDPRIDVAEARNARRLSDPITQKRAAAAAVEKGKRSGQDLLVADALVWEGDALVILGRPGEGAELYREAVELAERAGHQWTVGMALANLGNALRRMGDLDGAEDAYQDSLVIARRLGTGVGIAFQQYSLARLQQDRGNLKDATIQLEEAHASFVKMGDRMMEARIDNIMGEISVARGGELRTLRQTSERVLTSAREIGSRADEALALSNIGTVLGLQGDLAGAGRMHDSAYEILDGLSDSGLAAGPRAAGADLAVRLGDLSVARRVYDDTLAVRRRARDVIGVGRLLGGRARLDLQAGELAASAATANEQLVIGRKSDARSVEAWAQQNLGRVALERGDLTVAGRALQAALRLSLAGGENFRATEVRLDMARVALAEGEAGDAVLLARESAGWYGVRGISGGEARAYAVAAEALLRAGRLREAKEAAVRVRAATDGAQDRELRMAVAPILARLDAANGKGAKAVRELHQTIAEASAAGLVHAALEARLALAQILERMGDRAAAASGYREVRKEAGGRGFQRLAGLAASFLTASPSVAPVRPPSL